MSQTGALHTTSPRTFPKEKRDPTPKQDHSFESIFHRKPPKVPRCPNGARLRSTKKFDAPYLSMYKHGSKPITRACPCGCGSKLHFLWVSELERFEKSDVFKGATETLTYRWRGHENHIDPSVVLVITVAPEVTA